MDLRRPREWHGMHVTLYDNRRAAQQINDSIIFSLFTGAGTITWLKLIWPLVSDYRKM